MNRMTYLFLFTAAIFYNENDFSQARNVNKSSSLIRNIKNHRIGQVTNSYSTQQPKSVLLRVGASSEDTGQQQQRCRCVLFYQCDIANVINVTAGTDALNESGTVCTKSNEVCCREPVDLSVFPCESIIQEPTVVKTASTINDGNSSCVCTPVDQCIDDTDPAVSGAGLITVKFQECGVGRTCCPPHLIISIDRPVSSSSQPSTLETSTNPTSSSSSTPTDSVSVIDGPATDIITPPADLQPVCGIRNVYTDSLDTKISSLSGISETVFGEFPWMARLVRIDSAAGSNALFHCGASLLSRSIILTAAHCVNKIDKSLLKVHVGEYDTKATQKLHQDSTVSDIIIHPQFNNRTMFNDIAIIVVTDPFNYSFNVNPICMPANDMRYDKNKCIATGWGKNNIDGQFQNKLKKVELGLVPNDECQQKLRYTKVGKYFKLDRSFICAGGKRGADTCKGDGGGPLICEVLNEPNRYIQVGIVSWGVGCGDEVPAVYASIEANQNWINSTLTPFTR